MALFDRSRLRLHLTFERRAGGTLVVPVVIETPKEAWPRLNRLSSIVLDHVRDLVLKKGMDLLGYAGIEIHDAGLRKKGQDEFSRQFDLDIEMGIGSSSYRVLELGGIRAKNKASQTSISVQSEQLKQGDAIAASLPAMRSPEVALHPLVVSIQPKTGIHFDLAGQGYNEHPSLPSTTSIGGIPRRSAGPGAGPSLPAVPSTASPDTTGVSLGHAAGTASGPSTPGSSSSAEASSLSSSVPQTVPASMSSAGGLKGARGRRAASIGGAGGKAAAVGSGAAPDPASRGSGQSSKQDSKGQERMGDSESDFESSSQD